LLTEITENIYLFLLLLDITGSAIQETAEMTRFSSVLSAQSLFSAEIYATVRFI
jgi:hypothetical protein